MLRARPGRARCSAATPFGAPRADVGPDGLAISLPAGTDREAIAEINRLLVEGGISVYRLQHIQASLEAWFLSGHEPTGGRRNDDDLRRRCTPAPGPVPARCAAASRGDHRGSWIPTWGMITTRFMELRRRRGLMHRPDRRQHRHPGRLPRRAPDLPRRRPQVLRAGGRLRHLHHLVAGFMYIFGFIVAAVVGCTAGSVDLTEGMFRHLVITGPFPPGPVLRPDPGRAGHRHRHRGGRLHDRLRRVRVRRPDAAQLRRGQRAGRAVAAGARHLGGGACRRGHLQLQFQRWPGPRTARRRTCRAARADERAAAGVGDPDEGRANDHRSRHARRPRSGPSPSRSPTRTTPTTTPTSSSRRAR